MTPIPDLRTAAQQLVEKLFTTDLLLSFYNSRAHRERLFIECRVCSKYVEWPKTEKPPDMVHVSDCAVGRLESVFVEAAALREALAQPQTPALLHEPVSVPGAFLPRCHRCGELVIADGSPCRGVQP